MPWARLFQVAALTTILAIALDLMLLGLVIYSPLMREALHLLFADPLDVVMNVIVYVGVGALAVYVMETIFRKLIINVANLWGLVFCLAVVMTLASTLENLFGIPSLLIGAEQGSLLGLVLGVFATTWKYWRYSSRSGCRRCR